MPLRVTIKGVEVTCDDPKEAFELARLASANGSSLPQRGPGRPPKNGRPERELKAAADISTTLKFLIALRDGGPSGLNGDEIVTTMNLAGRRGIGGALIKVRRVLDGLGFKDREVFRKVGQPGKRHWKPGPRTDEAIKKLQENEKGDNL